GRFRPEPAGRTRCAALAGARERRGVDRADDAEGDGRGADGPWPQRQADQRLAELRLWLGPDDLAPAGGRPVHGGERKPARRLRRGILRETSSPERGGAERSEAEG